MSVILKSRQDRLFNFWREGSDDSGNIVRRRGRLVSPTSPNQDSHPARYAKLFGAIMIKLTGGYGAHWNSRPVQGLGLLQSFQTYRVSKGNNRRHSGLKRMRRILRIQNFS